VKFVLLLYNEPLYIFPAANLS